MATTHKPHYAAYAVTGEGEKTYWTRIGAAWSHKSGEGFNIELTATPLNGRSVTEQGGPIAFVRAWLDDAATSQTWRDQEEQARQFCLF